MTAFKRHSLSLAMLFLFLGVFAPGTTLASGTSNDDVPYGVASNWLYGRHLLAEGNNIEEALRYLHFAYRTHPDVPAVAWDFQEGLVAGQFFTDAVEVLDKLVADWPDSALYRFQRSQVNLHLGKNKAALADLRELRKQGKIDLDVIVGEATILASMGKADEALDVCREGIDLMPEHGPRLYLTMSVILDQEGRHKELPSLLAEAVSAYPDSPQLRDIQIRGLMSVGKQKEALAVALEADLHFAKLFNQYAAGEQSNSEAGNSAMDFPEMPPSFVVELADIYTQQGDPEKAIEILEPIFKEGSLGIEASLWLARLHMATGGLQRGQEVVDKILARWPRNGQAWFLRGQALRSEGHQEEALADMTKAAQFAPDDAQVRVGYVRALLLTWENDLWAQNKTLDQEEKLAQLRREAEAAVLLASDVDAEAQLVLGYAFRSTGQLDQAVTAFDKAALLPALHVTASLQLSVCLDDLDQQKKARGVLDRLRERYPEDPEVANSLGYYLAEKGKDLDYAEELIRQALQAKPGTGAYLDSMGWVLFQKGNAADAFDFIIQAVNVMPDDPIILEHLGRVLMEMGQNDEAQEMLQRAMALGGDKDRLEGYLEDLATQEDAE